MNIPQSLQKENNNKGKQIQSIGGERIRQIGVHSRLFYNISYVFYLGD
ncbi:MULTISPECIES: hypothetical protein [unclassified Pseudoalteromonas]|nr:hypothetical protein [Pseudoalteromonas sp. S1688]